MFDLFAETPPWQEPQGDGVTILRRRARDCAPDLLAAIGEISDRAVFRHLITPGGHSMSVAMTNCGSFGWVSDHRGYRYESHDPLTQKLWPPLPDWMNKLAREIAQEVGFTLFAPDACLINRYRTGAKMALHQDKDEYELAAPIVSVSLGVPAVFQFGGLTRSAPTQRMLLDHGDVIVWGGPARLNFHGVLPLKANYHPLTGSDRFNLTFRQVAKSK